LSTPSFRKLEVRGFSKRREVPGVSAEMVPWLTKPLPKFRSPPPPVAGLPDRSVTPGPIVTEAL
jgi:hypothetical protein